MSERAIQEAMSLSEEDIVTYASNLVEWFGSSRDVPEGHTGLCVVEKMYVATMVAKITEAFNEVEYFTKQLADYRNDLF